MMNRTKRSAFKRLHFMVLILFLILFSDHGLTMEIRIVPGSSTIFMATHGNQVLLADANGDAVVISAGADREIAFTRKPQGDGYQLITNFNLANKHNTFPGSFPCWRFDKAEEMLNKISGKEELTVKYFQSILEAVHIEGPIGNTEYSNVIDLRKGIVYLNHWHQYNETAVVVVEKEIKKHANSASVFAEGTSQTPPMPIKDLFSPLAQK
jgi:hypothetical protein